MGRKREFPDVRETLAEMVAIDSVSDRPNLPMIEYVEARLLKYGFSVQRHAYLDKDGVDKFNLIARRGPEGPGGLALVGHTDTVPYDPAWSEALVLTERVGRLYGRGSADTKGFIAAALAAVEGTRDVTLKAPLFCVFTADEEVGCVGARRLAKFPPIRPQYAIVGEPTGLTPVLAHKGYWAAEVTVTGQEGHSAYPNLGRSAIFDAARLLQRIEAISGRMQAERDDRFDPPWTTLNVGVIQGGKARDIIPGSCEFPIEWRPIPGQDGEKVAQLLDDAIGALREEDEGFEAHAVVVRRDDGVSTRADSPIVRFLEAESGKPAQTIPFGTELPYLNAMGAEGCVFGPGDIRVAHRTGEFVPIDELERAVDILERAILNFCS